MKKSGRHSTASPDSDFSDDDEIHDEAGPSEHDDQPSQVNAALSTKEDLSAVRPLNSARSTSSVVEDVIEKKGQYGRFAERWFSRKGWTTEKRRAQGMSIDSVGLDDPQSESPLAATTLDDAETSDLEIPNQVPKNDMSAKVPANVTNTLLPKLLRTTRMLFGSRSFFFSYELDITRRLGTNDSTVSAIPLHESADPLVSH